MRSPLWNVEEHLTLFVNSKHCADGKISLEDIEWELSQQLKLFGLTSEAISSLLPSLSIRLESPLSSGPIKVRLPLRALSLGNGVTEVESSKRVVKGSSFLSKWRRYWR
jgi:hypothetical protein